MPESAVLWYNHHAKTRSVPMSSSGQPQKLFPDPIEINIGATNNYTI